MKKYKVFNNVDDIRDSISGKTSLKASFNKSILKKCILV